MGTIWRLILGLAMMASVASCTSKKEQLQGQWHGYFVGHGGELNELVNVTFTSDSMHIFFVPDESYYSWSSQSFHIDSFFVGVKFDWSNDTVFYWSAEDEGFSFECHFCGKFSRGPFHGFAKHYLDNAPVKQLRLPEIDIEGAIKAVDYLDGKWHDSVPIFITQRELVAGDGTVLVQPEVLMRYGESIISDLAEISRNVAMMQLGHGQSFPYLFFFVDEAVSMEVVDAVLSSMPVNARKCLMYIRDKDAEQFEAVYAKQLTDLAVTCKHYLAILPIFNAYDSLGPLPPYVFGPSKYPIFSGVNSVVATAPIDIFITQNGIYLGRTLIDIDELLSMIDTLTPCKQTICIGFEGKVSYASFLTVYAPLKQKKGKNGEGFFMSYYSLDVYRQLNPKFTIESY